MWWWSTNVHLCHIRLKCTVFDISDQQHLNELDVASRENYEIEIVKGDMTEPLPFSNETFDLIFHRVSNCYVEDVISICKECYRVLQKGGILLVGLDNRINYLFNEEETKIIHKLPYNPLEDKKLYEEAVKNNWDIQFSHTIEEQIGGH